MSDKNTELDSVLYGDATPSLYSVLDDSARKWWYHEKMRKNGDEVGARVRERNNIRQHIDQIKKALTNGGYATISQSGGSYTITYSDDANVSGYSPRLVLAAYLAGVPVLDFRNAKDGVAIMKMPMPLIGDSKRKREYMADDIERLGDRYPTLMSHVPLADYLQRAQAIGATLHHSPTSRTKEDQY